MNLRNILSFLRPGMTATQKGEHFVVETVSLKSRIVVYRSTSTGRRFELKFPGKVDHGQRI